MSPKRILSRTALAIALLTFKEIFGLSSALAEGGPSQVHWRSFDESAFADAAREKKLVLVDLEAVWCHWCHAMDAKTDGDPAVAALLAKHYVAIKVDQDARPEISRRWEDWGWPATVILGSDGKELGIRSGYIAAPDMLRFLDAFANDPTPGPSVAALRKMQSVVA